MTKYIKHMAPKELVDELTPKYRLCSFISSIMFRKASCLVIAPGCKRIIVDPGYLQSLYRPNVHLTWESIEKIVPDGILLKNGEVVPLDVIIFATGFDLVCNYNF